jgi:hypothetical protein
MLKRHFMRFMLMAAIEAWLFMEAMRQQAWVVLFLSAFLLSRKLIVSFMADRLVAKRAVK